MTLFEYLTVAVSIVLALGVVRLVEGLGAASHAARRYWVHLTYVGLLIVMHLFLWWVIWFYREGVEWNFLRFAYVFVGPLILYFLATAMIPGDPGAIEDWRGRFFRMRLRFFLGLAAFIAYQGLGPLLLRSVPPNPRGIPGLTVGVALALAGAYSSSARAHAVLVVALSAAFLVGAVAVFFQPPELP